LAHPSKLPVINTNKKRLKLAFIEGSKIHYSSGCAESVCQYINVQKPKTTFFLLAAAPAADWALAVPVWVQQAAMVSVAQVAALLVALWRVAGGQVYWPGQVVGYYGQVPTALVPGGYIPVLQDG
jgi:hypothetical protein